MQDVSRSPVRSGSSRRVAFMRAAACLALCCLAACAGLNKKPEGPNLEPWPEIRSDFRVESLRARIHEYSITFAAEVDLAATAIEQRATDATVRRNALLWRVRAIPEMRKACFRLEPIGALVDAWIFARQVDQLFSEGAAKGAFGTFQPEAIAVSRRLLAQMQEIGGSIAVSPETRTEFERKFIDPWVAEHPLHDVTFVRESPIGRFAEQFPGRGDMFQSVGTMEGLAVGLSQQARIYLAELPRQVRGEVDLMRADILPPDSIASLQADLHMTAAAVDRIAATTEGIPPLALSERRAVVEEISRQRVLVMAAISMEREQAIGALVRALSAERSELLRTVESQRVATLAWATAERRETVADIRRELAASLDAVRGERAVVVTDVRHIVDVVLLRVALFLIAGVVLAPIVAHVYARVWPRRRD